MSLQLQDLTDVTPFGPGFYLGGSRDYELEYSGQHLRRFQQIAGLLAELRLPCGASLLDVGTTPFTFYLARCRVPRDYVDTRSRRLLESRRFLPDLILALRRP